MRRFGLLATMVLLAVVLLTSGVGTAIAKPQTELQKNQIEIKDASCTTDGQSFTSTFVINGMSKVGQISGGNDNIVITEFTVTFLDSKGNKVGGGTFDQGNAEDSNGNSPQGDALSCTGSTTTTLQGLGDVTADFVFEGFVTPRGE
ncbi:MAG: hypothetical protein H0U04_02360 [Rubrobacter sp.]|nr:hypothetical protein [Rubrobacter sp.]